VFGAPSSRASLKRGCVPEMPAFSFELDSRLPFKLAPADNGPFHRSEQGTKHHVIHHLPVTEPLQEQPPQQIPLLAFFEQKGKGGSQPVHRQKQCVVKQRLFSVSLACSSAPSLAEPSFIRTGINQPNQPRRKLAAVAGCLVRYWTRRFPQNPEPDRTLRTRSLRHVFLSKPKRRRSPNADMPNRSRYWLKPIPTRGAEPTGAMSYDLW
jgi:hypothetical protein